MGRRNRTKKPKWKEDAINKKKEQQKAMNQKQSSIPDEYKIIKKETVKEERKNHYMNKSKITLKLAKYRDIYYFLKSFTGKNKDECLMYKHFTNVLYELKKELIIDYDRAGRELLKSPKFRHKSKEMQYEMLAHSVERMFYYGYFYTFDINIGREGFSWLTSCHYNYFIQVINDTKKYSNIRQIARTRNIYQFENTNQEHSLDDHSVASIVKGLKYSHEDLVND